MVKLDKIAFKQWHPNFASPPSLYIQDFKVIMEKFNWTLGV
jgi:hypothetical protein